MRPLLRTLRAILSTRDGNRATPGGRAIERYRRAAWTALSSLAARVVAIGSTLISIPLLVTYLGPERYGLWAIVTSLGAFLALADFGVGSSIINALAGARGRNDEQEAAECISSGLVILVALAVLVTIAFVVVQGLIPWPSVFNVTSAEAVREAAPAVAVFVLLYALRFPAWLPTGVHTALQEGFWNSLWGTVANGVALIALVLAVRSGGSLPLLIAAFFGAPLVVNAVNGLVLFGRRYPHLRPRIRHATKRGFSRVGSASIHFLVLQVGMAIAFHADNIIGGWTCGPERVAEYSVATRLSGFIPTTVALALHPLWPAYAEAIERRDHDWAIRVFRRSTLVSTALAALLAAVMVVGGQGLLGIWIGEELRVETSLLLWLGIWAVVHTNAISLFTFVNGAGRTRLLAYTVGSMVPVSVASKYFLSDHFGIVGLAWGSIASYVVCVGVPIFALMPSIIRDVRGARISPS